MRINSKAGVTVDRKNLYIRLDGTMPRQVLLSSIDEIVDAAINSPSNFNTTASRKDVSLFAAIQNSAVK